MNKRWKLFAIIVVVIATFGFIGYSLTSNSFIARYGTEYTFDVRPIDPYDAFRGRYVVFSIIGEFPEDVNLKTSYFDRYYIDEKYALAAEQLVQRNRANAYVTIRVLGDRGVVTGLFVDGKAIEDYIIEHQQGGILN